MHYILHAHAAHRPNTYVQRLFVGNQRAYSQLINNKEYGLLMEKGAMRIRDSRIREILKAFDSKRSIHKITPVRQGVANPVFIVQSRSGDLVLRIFNPIAGDWKPKKEAAVYELLAREKIPSPHILFTDTTKKHIPFNYAISKRLPGKSLRDTTLSTSAKITVMEQLGDYLGRMHSITFDKFGDVKKTPHGFVVGEAHEVGVAKGIRTGPFKTWKAMHREIVKSRLHYFRDTEFAPLMPAIRQYFRNNEHLIDYAITPRLLHLDLNRGNIFVKDSTITGLLDVEESLIGHNEYDLMRTENLFENDTMRKAFFKRYTRHVKVDKGYEARRSFYALSRALVGVRVLILWKAHWTKKEYALEKARTIARIKSVLTSRT